MDRLVQKWSFLDDVGSWDEEQILRSNFHVHLAIGNGGGARRIGTHVHLI
uniref:Uncharacterized protein n=1 Tax=Anguilla anguilla TaxID=7936 RepID=A0A0E9VEJ1_ANGAN